MDEHLHVLILAEVHIHVPIDGLRLLLLQLLHHHVQGLFVTLHELGLGRIGSPADAWWQHVVHGLLVVVLLDVHGTHLHHTTLGNRSTQTLFIRSPHATYQVERAEAQHDGLLETREEHTHETDASEVVDAAHLPFILHHGDTELIPVHTRGVAITELHTTGTHVGDETIGRRRTVTIGIEHFGRDTHLVLVVALILVEGVVEVDILHIGSTLIAGIVRFRLLVGVG